MIIIKSDVELNLMKKSGRILRDTFSVLEEHIKSGITTLELDNIAREFIVKNNAHPTFYRYNGFPKSICVSIDEEVVHGIPKERYLTDGMIVSIDIGVNYQNFNTDAARTYSVGKISEKKQQLIDVTKQCFFEGIKDLKQGSRVSDIGKAIQEYAERFGFFVVRDLVGHGIGKDLHEDPQIPNFKTHSLGAILKKGMTLAIEPMINIGTYEVKVKSDGWTIITRDGQPSGHYENTIIVLEDGVEIIT
ncbi:MAG: type I methionyl aminopeptidase [Firmicutes bacterium]|nr:type I methionyl aminopeptidase [Bacillota bacterium]